MQKPVRSVLNAARAQIGVYSQAKLPDETMKLILHQVLDDLNNQRIMESDDRFLHTVPAVLTVSGDEFTVKYTVGAEDIIEFMPQFLYWKDPSDPNNARHKVYLSNLDNYAADAIEKKYLSNQATGVFYGNNYDADGGGMKLRMNMKPELVSRMTWELVYKNTNTKVLNYNDIVPFPEQHTNCLETGLALRSLDAVDDASAAWDKKYARLNKSLSLLFMEQTQLYMKWVEGEPKTRTRQLPQYDYKRGMRRARYPIAPIEE